MSNVYFQQDSATCDTSQATIDLLRKIYEGPLISRNGDVNWPPRSRGLTPVDHYLWDAIKEMCYSEKPESIQHLKVNIRDANGEIRLHALEKVYENLSDRMRY